jgi:hypothetical protein
MRNRNAEFFPFPDEFLRELKGRVDKSRSEGNILDHAMDSEVRGGS